MTNQEQIDAFQDRIDHLEDEIEALREQEPPKLWKIADLLPLR